MKEERSQERGFSLVEVVIAIGLVTFCLVALMALFSVGFSTSREATADTVLAGLYAQIASDPQAETNTNNYDNRGQVTTNAATALYACRVTKSAVSTNEFAGISTNLTRVTIQMTSPASVPAAKRRWTNTFYGFVPTT